MNVFNDLIKVDENGNIRYNKWIEWEHFLIPNKPEWLRDILRNLMVIFAHCLNCTALDGCYLLDNNKPKQPLHEHCDCRKKVVSFSKVKTNSYAECNIAKFTEYVFKNDKDSKGKNKIFYDLGYSINDSEYLKKEYCKQALEQYLSGNYRLKNLDKRGQRLAIPINLKGKIFYSGWMLCPEGKIRNTTPFGGWIK